MTELENMKVYEDQDKTSVKILRCSNPQLWYADRVGMSFPLSRTCTDWDHVKVSLTGVESEVYHGDYQISVEHEDKCPCGCGNSRKWQETMVLIAACG